LKGKYFVVLSRCCLVYADVREQSFTMSCHVLSCHMLSCPGF